MVRIKRGDTIYEIYETIIGSKEIGTTINIYKFMPKSGGLATYVGEVLVTMHEYRNGAN